MAFLCCKNPSGAKYDNRLTGYAFVEPVRKSSKSFSNTEGMADAWAFAEPAYALVSSNARSKAFSKSESCCELRIAVNSLAIRSSMVLGQLIIFGIIDS